MTSTSTRPRASSALGALIAEGFFSRLSFGLISFALPLYARQLGMSLGEVGLLISLNVGVAVVLKPLAGWVADRTGVKRSLMGAIGLRSLVALGLALATGPWHLFATRALHGVSISVRDPSVDVLIAEHGGKRTIASAFAWYQTAKSVAGSLGKAAAGIMLTMTAGRYWVVFLVAWALSAVPALVVGLYVPESPANQPHGRHLAEQRPPGRETSPRLVPLMGLAMLITATSDMLHGLLPILATEHAGLSEAETGILYLVSTVVMMAAGPAFGWLSDHVSRKLVLGVRSAANTLSSVLYLLAPNPLGLLAAKSVDDAGKAAFRPAWGSVMAQVASFDRRRRARTMSRLSLGEDLGAIAGPILAGVLWGAWGVGGLMGARIVLAAVTEVYAVRTMRRLEP
ncbi:MAG: MFS transporter [Acidimicrobiia bacterium]